MRGGNFEKYVEQQYAMRRANKYLGSDDGRRMAISVMPAKFQDKNMVAKQDRTIAEQQKTNELTRGPFSTTHNPQPPMERSIVLAVALCVSMAVQCAAG